MTYPDILKEMERHGMNKSCIERYEAETVAPNKHLIHIVADGEKKKMYLTAEVADLNTAIDFNKDNPRYDLFR
nr:MAG TPA: hypothetical protein [Bacteriophage sp.]